MLLPKFWYILGYPNPPIGNQVKHLIILLSLFLFSFTIISCRSSDDEASTTCGNSFSTTTTDNTTITSKTTIPNFKVAFIGDQGLGSNAEKVLDLIVAECADLVVISGDFGYHNASWAPFAWDSMLRQHLGDIPYVASIGNHEVDFWSNYQYYLEKRLNEAGISWSGDLGVNSHLSYKGLFIVLSGVGTQGVNHDNYIRDSLAKDDSMWSVVSWHKVHNKMQVSGFVTEVNWPTYEICRKAGAIVATGHVHNYSRTYMLTDLPDTAGSSANPEYDASRGTKHD